VRALRPAAENAAAVGVDIGGTSIKAGMISQNGSVSLTTQVPTIASNGRDAIIAGLVSAIEHVLADAHGQGMKPCGIGIASAGAIGPEDGSVFAATENLPGWAGFELREFVEQRFKLPTYVVNDAHAAALAELHFGLGRTLSDFVAITVGTGIGGGIVSQGKLLKGQHGFAGTIGHHVIRIDGRQCNCGRRGCLEAYVSTASLLREYAQRSGEARATTTDDAAMARRISDLALSGDAAAQGAYSALAAYLAEGLANIFNLLDPQAVFLSGGLVKGHQEFISEVECKIEKLIHFGSKRKPRVYLAEQGQYAGVQGAATLVFSAQDV
jgi:glucokinase-like ROK family protein